MTVRRDLEYLEKKNMVKILHGGAVLTPSGSPGEERLYVLTQESSINTEEKKKIGMRAASMVQPEDVIIIDAGSTTEWLARHVPDSADVSVLCYSLNVLIELQRKSCRITLAGGDFHPPTLVFESPESSALIHRYRASKAFMSARGVNVRLGITCSNAYESELKKAVLNSSLARILLVDSSKFGKVGAAYYADLDDFNTIITDSGIPPEYRSYIENRGIELVIV